MSGDRPRDALGRPLPIGSPHAVPALPAFDGIASDDAWHRAIGYLDGGQPFHAHEVFEARWRCCPEPERPLWRALAQWGAALTHEARGNMVGAKSVGRNALRSIDGVEPVRPVDLERVRSSLGRLCAAG